VRHGVQSKSVHSRVLHGCSNGDTHYLWYLVGLLRDWEWKNLKFTFKMVCHYYPPILSENRKYWIRLLMCSIVMGIRWGMEISIVGMAMGTS